LIAIASSLAFAAIAASVAASAAPLAAIDDSAAAACHRWRSENPQFEPFARTLTQSVGPGALAGLAGLGALFLLYRRQYIAALVCIVLLAGIGPFEEDAIKKLVPRSRPSYSGVQGQDSFPSGFVVRAVVAYGFLAYLLSRGRAAGARAVVLVPIVAFLLVGCLCRLYLGRHYPTDVLGGIFAGLALLFAGLAIVEATWRTGSPVGIK